MIKLLKFSRGYLDSNGGGDAKENILDFLERDSDEDLLLNSNDQRIFFIANNYRKEVTSTVLWLLDHDIQIRCFKATPYSLGSELFLQIEQIIPLPETAEYMIDAMEKKKEKKERVLNFKKSQSELIEFWGLLKNMVKDKSHDFLANVTPRPNYYMGFLRARFFCLLYWATRYKSRIVFWR